MQEIVKCETQTDCDIKKKCFENGRCEHPFPTKFVDAPAVCIAMEYIERVPTHVLKCSVGEYAKMVTVIEAIDRNEVHIIENGTNAIPVTDSILKIDLLSHSNVDNEVKVKCSASLYYFSTPIVFALEQIDGSFEYLDRDLIHITDPYEPLLITRITSATRRIHCFAPLAGSSEWRNISVVVKVFEPTSTSTTSRPSVFRGDSILRRRTRL